MQSIIAIVGMGPRGLCTVERLLNELPKRELGFAVKILIFDGGGVGSGVHDVAQPAYLLMNTICSQVTAFGQPGSRTRRPMGSPSLFEWARQNGHLVTDHDGIRRRVLETDYLPRQLLGQYLGWAFRYVVRNAGSEAEVAIHDEYVTRIQRTPCGGGYEIETARAGRLLAANVVICTGHALGPGISHASRIRPGLVSEPYPIAERIGLLPDGAEVGVEGFGLAAIDVLSAGSVGRGGGFHRDASGRLRYEASGRELRMSFFSRSGLPPSARAINQKPSGSTHQPQFLTDHYVDGLRRPTSSARPNGGGEADGIDFERDVLPRIRLEFDLAYNRALLRDLMGGDAAERFATAFVKAEGDRTAVRPLLDAIPVEARLSLDDLAREIPEEVLDSPASYNGWLLRRMEVDLAEARKGNVDSPLKAACDVLRDLRPQMRRAIDAAGLTPASHAAFVRRFLPLMNRLSVGPPACKIEEFVALVEAGIADVSIGPLLSVREDGDAGHVVEGRVGRRRFPYLVRARVGSRSADDVSLLGLLRRDGLARRFSNGAEVTGEVDVDHRHRVISPSGVATPGLWAMGTPAEGSRFYTFVLPSPNAAASPLTEAEHCVDDVLNKVERDLGRNVERLPPAHLVLAAGRGPERRPTAA